MRSIWGSALIPIACLAVVGCHLPGMAAKAPTGQVAATVDGEEITVRELQAELAGANIPNDPKIQKAAEQQALQLIIIRKLLAKAAKEQGLDKTPEFALTKSRAEEGLLAQTLEAKLAKEVRPPTRADVTSFVSDHPNIFAERKIYTVDQIRTGRPSSPTLLKEIEPLNTLPDIEALLTREHVEYRRATNSIDAVGSDPELVDKVAALPPNEVFVIPSRGGLLINQITATKVVPFTGDPAISYATTLLTRQNVQNAVKSQLSLIVGKGLKSVHYNAAYQPKPGAKPPAPAVAPGTKADPNNPDG